MSEQRMDTPQDETVIEVEQTSTGTWLRVRVRNVREAGETSGATDLEAVSRVKATYLAAVEELRLQGVTVGPRIKGA